MALVESFGSGIWLSHVRLADFDVRGALIVGRDMAVVWDTLSKPRDMRPYPGLIGGRELAIVYSHADWDHIWGTGGLQHESARIIGHTRCAERFAADVPLALAQKQSAEPGKWDDVVLVQPTETFEQPVTLDLGGLTVELHHLPGHTPDCIVAFVPERGLLLAGDTVETPCPVVPADSPLAEWIAGLRHWCGHTGVRRVVPSHGPTGGREILERNIGYLEGILHGQPVEPTGRMTPFYRETHLSNVRWRRE